jgi:hypothetical protein
MATAPPAFTRERLAQVASPAPRAVYFPIAPSRRTWNHRAGDLFDDTGDPRLINLHVDRPSSLMAVIPRTDDARDGVAVASHLYGQHEHGGIRHLHCTDRQDRTEQGLVTIQTRSLPSSDRAARDRKEAHP